MPTRRRRSRRAGIKVLTVVGARPQFIKCAPVSLEIRRRGSEILVHTGQHYDDALSGSFFRELGIAKPDFNLGAGSGLHGAQTARMIEGLEKLIIKTRPDWVLVYGDTNSTLAGALAAAKLHVPLAHVEAGLRSYNRRMPEELNRVLTDHVSSLLFCPNRGAALNLRKEGIRRGVLVIGDVMRESLAAGLGRAKKNSRVMERLGLKKGHFILATVHRAENTDDPSRLKAITRAFLVLARKSPLVWPLHPRTRARLGSAELRVLERGGVRLLTPLSYLDMILLTASAQLILTDSGGVQKEACWLGTPCTTLRDETEWPETIRAGANILAGADFKAILRASEGRRRHRASVSHGQPSAAIVRELLKGSKRP